MYRHFALDKFKKNYRQNGKSHFVGFRRSLLSAFKKLSKPGPDLFVIFFVSAKPNTVGIQLTIGPLNNGIIWIIDYFMSAIHKVIGQTISIADKMSVNSENMSWSEYHIGPVFKWYKCFWFPNVLFQVMLWILDCNGPTSSRT